MGKLGNHLVPDTLGPYTVVIVIQGSVDSVKQSSPSVRARLLNTRPCSHSPGGTGPH